MVTWQEGAPMKSVDDYYRFLLAALSNSINTESLFLLIRLINEMSHADASQRMVGESPKNLRESSSPSPAPPSHLLPRDLPKHLMVSPLKGSSAKDLLETAEEAEPSEEICDGARTNPPKRRPLKGRSAGEWAAAAAQHPTAAILHFISVNFLPLLIQFFSAVVSSTRINISTAS